MGSIVFFRFTDIQEKAVMGMNIIPSMFIEKMHNIDIGDMVQLFDFFINDLPHPGSFEAELLQWQVSNPCKIISQNINSKIMYIYLIKF